MIDDSFFVQPFFLNKITKSLPDYFPNDYQAVIISLYNGNGTLLLTKRPASATYGQYDEVSLPLQFIFTDWRVGIHMRQITEKEWAKQFFQFNLVLMLLLTGLIIAGLVMALRIATQQLKLSRLKTDFVANISHDLRTPLSSILVFSELLSSGRIKEIVKAQEYGQYIENEGQKLMQLIDRVLDFAQQETGSRKYQMEEMDIPKLVSEVVAEFALRIKPTGFLVNLEIRDRPLMVMVDKLAISQAIINLLDNAVKYSDKIKEIKVQVTKQSNYACIAVIDQGIGIPIHEQEKIFDKFYRVHNSLQHNIKGTGLGLSIVKHIVQAHGGKITLESNTGKGTTFNLWIKIYAENIDRRR